MTVAKHPATIDPEKGRYRTNMVNIDTRRARTRITRHGLVFPANRGLPPSNRVSSLERLCLKHLARRRRSTLCYSRVEPRHSVIRIAMISRWLATDQRQAGRRVLCRHTVHKEVLTEILHRRGVMSHRHMALAPQADPSSPRVHTVHQVRILKGIRRHLGHRVHPTQDLPFRRIRAMNAADPLNLRASRRGRQVLALRRVPPALSRPIKTRSTRRICHRMDHNHCSIRVIRRLLGHLNRPLQMHTIQTLI